MRARVPYAGTEVPPERTQAEVTKMLYEHHAKAVQWTSDANGRVRLKFQMGEGERTRNVVIDPPLLLVPKRTAGRRGSVANMTDLPASMRLLKWWLKTKLEAVEYGLVSFEEEFLAEIAGTLPNGEETTIGRLIIPKLGSLPTEDLAKALPSGEE